jgi:hypothetical protein
LSLASEVREILSEGRVETIAKPLTRFVVEVPVAIRCRADRRVAEMLLHLLEMRPRCDQECRAGVPEIVEAKPVDELGARDCRVVVPTYEIPMPDRTSVT